MGSFGCTGTHSVDQAGVNISAFLWPLSDPCQGLVPSRTTGLRQRRRCPVSWIVSGQLIHSPFCCGTLCCPLLATASVLLIALGAGSPQWPVSALTAAGGCGRSLTQTSCSLCSTAALPHAESGPRFQFPALSSLLLHACVFTLPRIL